MKNSMMFLLFAFLVILTTACSNADAEGSDNKNTADSKEKITLKLAVSQSATHPIVVEAIEPFMEKVTEATDGQVEFDFYPAEQLGKAADLLDLTSNGVADIGFIINSYYPSQMPITSPLMGVPGLYTGSYEGSMAYHEINKSSPVLESDYLSNGVRPIFSYAAPASELLTAGKEIKVPADLKDMKVRVSGEIANKAMSILGASPINLTVSELYEGFERSVYDAIIANTASSNDYGLGELAEYGTMGLGFGGVGTGLVINEKVYESLPENVQEAIVRIGDELTESNAKFYDAYTADLVQEFMDDGIDMYELSEDEKAQWEKFYGEVEASLLKEQNNSDLEETLEEFKKKVKEFE